MQDTLRDIIFNAASHTRSERSQNMQDYMDSTQLARYLRCSVQTVERYIKGTHRFPPLPYVPLGDGRIVFEIDAVRDWAQRCNPKRWRMIQISEAKRRALEAERTETRA